MAYITYMTQKIVNPLSTEDTPPPPPQKKGSKEEEVSTTQGFQACMKLHQNLRVQTTVQKTPIQRLGYTHVPLDKGRFQCGKVTTLPLTVLHSASLRATLLAQLQRHNDSCSSHYFPQAGNEKWCYQLISLKFTHTHTHLQCTRSNVEATPSSRPSQFLPYQRPHGQAPRT